MSKGRVFSYGYKGIAKTVIGCHPSSSRLMTLRLRANPFNVTIIQVHAQSMISVKLERSTRTRTVSYRLNPTAGPQDILILQGD